MAVLVVELEKLDTMQMALQELETAEMVLYLQFLAPQHTTLVVEAGLLKLVRKA
jgi:hypothetical protein